MWLGLVSPLVKDVFTGVDSVVFELELQNPETIETLLRCKNLEGGQRLEYLVPSEVYDRLGECRMSYQSAQ